MNLHRLDHRIQHRKIRGKAFGRLGSQSREDTGQIGVIIRINLSLHNSVHLIIRRQAGVGNGQDGGNVIVPIVGNALEGVKKVCIINRRRILAVFGQETDALSILEGYKSRRYARRVGQHSNRGEMG